MFITNQNANGRVFPIECFGFRMFLMQNSCFDDDEIKHRSSFSIILVELDEFHKIKIIKNQRLDQAWNLGSLLISQVP